MIEYNRFLLLAIGLAGILPSMLFAVIVLATNHPPTDVFRFRIISSGNSFGPIVDGFLTLLYYSSPFIVLISGTLFSLSTFVMSQGRETKCTIGGLATAFTEFGLRPSLRALTISSEQDHCAIVVSKLYQNTLHIVISLNSAYDDPEKRHAIEGKLFSLAVTQGPYTGPPDAAGEARTFSVTTKRTAAEVYELITSLFTDIYGRKVSDTVMLYVEPEEHVDTVDTG